MNRIQLVLLLTLATLLPGCCYEHTREWRQWSAPVRHPAKLAGIYPFTEKTEAAPTPQSPFDGRWIGKWTSARHHTPFSRKMEDGELRCVFTKIDPYRWRANFRAEWLLGASHFLTDLYGHERGHVLHLHGEASAIVPYRYDGVVTPNHFVLHYDSSYDTGTFELRKLP